MDQDRLIRLDLSIPDVDREVAVAVLFELAPFGWEEEILGERVVFRVHFEDPLRAEQVGRAFSARFPEAEVQERSVQNRDWALAWREFFTAVPAGEDFIVIAPWMEEEILDRHAQRIPIVIEPKTAFGTGHHDTTAFCLQAVSELFRNGRIDQGMRFFDLGTGSGILAIGCAKLGLTGVGLDIDPLAVENSHENMQLNGVAESFSVGLGSLDALDAMAGDERFDLVMANILAEPLIELASGLVARVKQGGCLILSGLLRIQAEAVTQAYTRLGLGKPRAIEGGEWAALVWDDRR
ncbi:MAG: 50S ribosomal protein L11 methyltransferase [Desulfovibrio sp.]|nr:MAG: 50S ribosomal protein L11 methyltransferase [Desulfovibrio sp.]